MNCLNEKRVKEKNIRANECVIVYKQNNTFSI